MKKLFIDENIKVIKGAKAEKLINEKNDSKYIEKDAILKVDKNRWMEAQNYEHKTWLEKGKRLSDDRNYEHSNRFNSYKSLIEYQNNKKILNAIELGCGPFTNMRTLIPLLPDLKEIHLLDPLLNDYLNHPYCQYKSGKIDKIETKFHPLPIEEFSNYEKFDLVVMINVLEHCYDIPIILDRILKIMHIGSVFVFSDVYYLENDVKRMVYEVYDAGHPLKLSSTYLNQFLSGFSKIYENEFHGLYGQSWRHDKYFIGTKKE